VRRTARFIFIASIFLCNALSYAQHVAPPYEVGTWQGFRSAAVTYTFDDNCPNQLSIAVPMFNEFGFPLTLFTVTSSTWAWPADWAGLHKAASQGHEIASHTVSHPSYLKLTDSAQTYESKASQDTIDARIGGHQCVTIAYPYCHLGNSALVQQLYVAARGCSGQIENKTPADFMNISSIVCGSEGPVKTSAAFKALVTSAADSNGWVIYLFHGINGSEPGAYSPMAADTIRASLEYLKANKEKFWVSTFGNVARYVRERNSVSVIESSVQQKRVTVVVTDTLDHGAYNVPLTIRRPLPAGWISAAATQNGRPVSTSIVEVNAAKFVMFDAVPNAGEITLTKGE
jgi:peptidoglycan-N-acetylglucosamine deacetylase